MKKHTRVSLYVGMISAICLTLTLNIVTAEPRATAFNHAADSAWTRYRVADAEFSVMLPVVPAMSSYSVKMLNLAKSPLRHQLGAYEDGVVYTISVFDRKQSLDEFVGTYRQNSISSLKRELKIDGIKGKEYESETDDRRWTQQFFATDKRIYIFSVCGSTLTRPEARMARFLNSISFSRIQQSQEVLDGPGIPWTPADQPTPETEAQIVTGKQVTRKAVVLSKPEPTYTEEARKLQITGTVVIRCVFTSSGAVANLHFVSGLAHGLNERASFAAKQIKFMPAIKDGHFVSMWMELQYNFNLY